MEDDTLQTAEYYVEEMTRVSNSKYQLLLDMLTLTIKQKEYLNSENIELLQEIINKKQTIINEIDLLDERFNEFFNNLKLSLGVTSLEDISRSSIKGAIELIGIVKKIMEIIKKISEQEEDNNIMAKGFLKSLGSEINKINQNRAIRNAYGMNNARSDSYYIDKKK